MYVKYASILKVYGYIYLYTIVIVLNNILKNMGF